jgi:titin
MRFLRTTFVCCWAGCLVGCAGKAPSPALLEAAPFAAAPTGLTATLASPVDIDLQWQNHASDAAAYLIEFTLKPPGPYTIVTAVPPDQNTFRHARLAPQTRFTYRVRALFGKPSNVVEVVTGKPPATMPPHTPLRMPQPVMPPSDAESDEPPAGPRVEKSVRDPRAADAAAPTDLTAALVTPVHVVLRWQDNAQDEEGYVLEASRDASQGFFVLGLFPPDTTEFEIPDRLPAESKWYYRVRAYFSKASNKAVQTTGLDPPLSGGAPRPAGAR